jgi:hypothetical protein
MGPYYEIPTRRKVTLVAALASSCALALVLVALLAYRSVAVKQQVLKAASAEGEVISHQAIAAAASNNVAAADAVLLQLKANPEVESACIYSRDGRVMAKYIRPGFSGDQFPLPELDSQHFENGSFVLFRSIESGADVVGTIYLRTEVKSTLAGLPHRTEIFGSIAGLLLALAIGFGIWLQRLLSMQANESVGIIPLVPEESDAPPQVTEVSRDELRLLSKKVDVISTKLQKIEKQLTKPKEPKPLATKTVAKVEASAPVVPAAQPILTVATLDLNIETKKVLETMREQIQSRNAEVLVQPNLPLVVAERSVIGQILRSLITNALQFCPEGSRPRIRVGGCINGNSVRLWVHDNGVGITPEAQKVLFTSTDRGAGNGLALVKQGVEKMRGQVGFDSATGQGSTFWIELPQTRTEGSQQLAE